MVREVLDWKKLFLKHKLLLTGLFLAALILFPLVTTSEFSKRVVSTVMIYCILAMGNMIISGYTGMLNMGQAAFYGVGAYISALLSVQFQLPFLLCFLLAGIGAGLCGFLLAFPCLRVQTDFLSLITIAFANVFLTVVMNWVSVTRGPMGIPSIPSPSLFGFEFDSPNRMYFLLFTVTVGVYILLSHIIHSKIGRALQATRDDEIGARSVGINVKRQKIFAFVVGTFCAGLAGSLMAHYIQFVGPSNFTFDESLLVMQMCIIGGLGSLPGAIVGASFMMIMPEMIRGLAVYRIGVGGLIMILCMLFRPQGIMGSQAFAGSSGLQDQLKRRLKLLRTDREKKAKQAKK